MEELIRKPALLWCRGESPSVPAEVIRQLAESAEYVLSACGGGLMAEDVEKAFETGLKRCEKRYFRCVFGSKKCCDRSFSAPMCTGK